jgi:hypothetical protein
LSSGVAAVFHRRFTPKSVLRTIEDCRRRSAPVNRDCNAAPQVIRTPVYQTPRESIGMETPVVSVCSGSGEAVCRRVNTGKSADWANETVRPIVLPKVRFHKPISLHHRRTDTRGPPAHRRNEQIRFRLTGDRQGRRRTARTATTVRAGSNNVRGFS